MADCPRAKWSWLLHAASTRAAESIARLSAEATRVDYLNIAEFERNVLLTCNGVRISWWWVVQSSSSSSSLLVSFQLSHLTSVSKHISQGGAKGGQWPLQDVQKILFSPNFYIFCPEPCLAGLQRSCRGQECPQQGCPLQDKFLATPMSKRHSFITMHVAEKQSELHTARVTCLPGLVTDESQKVTVCCKVYLKVDVL